MSRAKRFRNCEADAVAIPYEVEWKVFEPLTINFGARFDIVDEYAHAYRLSPRVNIVLQATGSTTLHARLCPLLYTASAGACTVTNPETVRRHIQPTGDLQSTVVKPERANYFDAGMTEQFTRSFSMGIDSYYKTSRDLIDEGQFGSALIFTPFNYAKETSTASK
jgi:outer membrane receptor protein involved in Fe transport